MLFSLCGWGKRINFLLALLKWTFPSPDVSFSYYLLSKPAKHDTHLSCLIVVSKQHRLLIGKASLFIFESNFSRTWGSILVKTGKEQIKSILGFIFPKWLRTRWFFKALKMNHLSALKDKNYENNKVLKLKRNYGLGIEFQVDLVLFLSLTSCISDQARIFCKKNNFKRTQSSILVRKPKNNL